MVFGRQRKANFTTVETDILIKEVEARQDVLLSKQTDVISTQDKQAAWHAVAECVNRACTGEPRTIREVKKKWENIQAANRRKAILEHLKRPLSASNLVQDIETRDEIIVKAEPEDLDIFAIQAQPEVEIFEDDCSTVFQRVPSEISIQLKPPPLRPAPYVQQSTLPLVTVPEDAVTTKLIITRVEGSTTQSAADSTEVVEQTDTSSSTVQPAGSQAEPAEKEQEKETPNIRKRAINVTRENDGSSQTTLLSTVIAETEPIDDKALEYKKLQILDKLLRVEKKRLKVEKKRLKIEQLRLGLVQAGYVRAGDQSGV